MRISDWSSDVCSSDLQRQDDQGKTEEQQRAADAVQDGQLARQGQAIAGNLRNANIAELRTWLGSGVGHDGLGVTVLGIRDSEMGFALAGKRVIFAQRTGWYQIVGKKLINSGYCDSGSDRSGKGRGGPRTAGRPQYT